MTAATQDRAESRTNFLERMDAEWPAFTALLDSVPDEQYEAPGVTDNWCLKELLGHVNFWASKAAHDVAAVAAGRPDEVQVPGNQQKVDEWNAREAARGARMSVADLKQALNASHAAARKAVEDAPEGVLAVEMSGRTVGHRAAEDTYRHYHEHAEHIREWLKTTTEQ
jgi:hypothetical protein